MYNSVEEYLQKQQQEKVEREKSERQQVMYQEGLMEKIYATEPNPSTKEYSHVDETGKRYKLRYLPISDEQYKQVAEYAKQKARRATTQQIQQQSLFYEHIGHKLKVLAIIHFLIGALAAILCGSVVAAFGIELGGSLIFSELQGIMIALGAVIMVIGSVFAWLSSCRLYGFGQLIENSDKLVAIKQQENDK